MRAKREIENQLAHFRTNCANAGSAENEIWIRALEWVLGDEEHQRKYAIALQGLREAAPLKPGDIAAIALHMALEHLE